MKIKISIFIINLMIPIFLYASKCENADTLCVSCSQVYHGGDSNFILDFAKNLKLNKDIFFPGIVCDVKIYFDSGGEIYNIEIDSRQSIDNIEIADSIKETLRHLPNWQMPPAKEKIRMVYLRKLHIAPAR